MISGSHSIIYSKDAEADRAFLRDILGLPHVDVGDGWLIFALPPSEIAIHPAEKNDLHEFFFICDDVEALVESLAEREVECTAPVDRGWGILTQVTLPGGGKVSMYQPRHERPASGKARGAKAARKPAARMAKAKPSPARKASARKATARKASARKATARKPAARTKAGAKSAGRRVAKKIAKKK
jgi:hypothetical protein